ncbi:MAG: ABC transporter ATP-binding protein/permease [Nitrospira sp.]|nr:ABC transporter ATP-binding protein/permease [Nitrospira sp.]
MKEILKLYGYLPASKKLEAIGAVFLIFIGAILEIGGVISIMPFLVLLGSPDLATQYPAVNWLYEHLGRPPQVTFAVYLGVLCFVMVAIGALVKICVHYFVQACSQDVSSWIKTTLFDAYLHQPYPFFLLRHTADMSRNILSESGNAVAHVVLPAYMICSYVLVIILLVLVLMIVHPWASGTVLLFLGGLYSLLSYAVNPMARSLGTKVLDSNRRCYSVCSEAFGGIKTVKSQGLEFAYNFRFRSPALDHTKAQAMLNILAYAPRHLVETLGIGAVIAIAMYLLLAGEPLGNMLSLLGLYVLAGNRLLPAAQQLYQSFAQIRFGMPSLRSVLGDLALVITKEHKRSEDSRVSRLEPKKIELVEVGYRYPNSNTDALRKVSFSIIANTTVGIVGTSGSGKTTLGDILLGLLRPSQGALLLDGVQHDLVSSLAWKRSVGYVSQDIFLVDGSFADNIAFGVPASDIDMEAVMRAATLADIYEFIMRNCPEGFATQIGEKGVRLSGGQRQRVAIARALYHDPPILIFDEATSALDSATERTIIESIEALSHKKTIIMIAHRMQTIRHADQIIVLSHGRVVGTGTFDELLTKVAEFRAIAAMP